MSSYEAIKVSIRAGLGIAVLPALSLSAAEFSLRKQWHLAYPKGKHLSPGAKVFCGYLLEHLRVKHDVGPNLLTL